ncbi:MAG: hypothetical protein ACJ741_12255 [Pyrinomonadaceae bacterium]
MKPFLVVLLLTLPPAFLSAGPLQDNAGADIVAGNGWGEITLGAPRALVDEELGKQPEARRYGDVYYVDYPAAGIQVSFSGKGDQVRAIYFFNKQRLYRQFATFRGKTSKGIGWESSAAQVITVYGKPVHDYEGDDGGPWRRLVFKGIDFLFEDNKLVRISVPGD